MTQDARAAYDRRFRSFLRQVMAVRRMEPKARYLYPLMDSVPFQDLETAVQMTAIAHGAAVNDNRGGK